MQVYTRVVELGANDKVYRVTRHSVSGEIVYEVSPTLYWNADFRMILNKDLATHFNDDEVKEIEAMLV